MRQNIVVTRGDTRVLGRTLERDAFPIDLTGAAVTMTVDGLFTKTVGAGIELVADSGDEGEITITIDPADTDGAPDWRRVYHYDIEVEESDGTVTTPYYGAFIVTPDVTA